MKNNTAPPQPFFNRWRILFLLTIVASIIVYLPSLKGLKIWDDNILIGGTGIGGGESIVNALTVPFLGAYFRPLVSVTFYLENQIWNGNPFFYHQTNILIHAASTAILIGLLLQMFHSRKIALLGGLLFAVQPAQVSTVAWIGGRTDSMCSLLVLIFAYTLILGIRSQGRRKVALITASVLAFFAAMVTKEQIIVMLLLVPLSLRAFGKQPRTRDHLRLAAPYAISAFFFVCLWLAAYPNPFKPMFRGAAEQILTAGEATTYYALLLLTPAPRWMHTLSLGWFELQGAWPSLVGLTLAAALLFVTVKMHKRHPAAGWLLAFVLLAMLPVSNLVPLPSLLVAPYRAGVAGIAVAALIAFAAIKAYRIPMVVRSAVIGAYVLLCAGLTWWGSGRWADSITLFTEVANNDPVSIIARRNLSSSLMQEGKAKEAQMRMEEILTFIYGGQDWRDPERAYALLKNDKDVRWRVKSNQGNLVEPEDWVGELYSQLAFSRNETMDLEGSKTALQAGLKIDPMNPSIRIALAQYAFYYNDKKAAYRHMIIAVASRPNDPKFRTMLAQAYDEAGLKRLAEIEYRNSIELQPWFGPTYLDLAGLLMDQGRLVEAEALLSESKACRVLDQNALDAELNKLANLRKKQAHGEHPT